MSEAKSSRKRRAWKPLLYMALLLALGLWLVRGPSSRNIHPRAGATTLEVQIGNERGALEVFRPDSQGEPEFRVLLRNGFESPVMSAQQFRESYGEGAYHQALRAGSNRLFGLLRITSWPGVAWVGLGLLGQVIFAGRMFVQWWASEKKGQSVVPPAFWWMSLVGGLMVFVYFVWRQDIVGVLGQCSGIVIYARNLRLIQKQERRAQQAAGDPPPATDQGPAANVSASIGG